MLIEFLGNIAFNPHLCFLCAAGEGPEPEEAENRGGDDSLPGTSGSADPHVGERGTGTAGARERESHPSSSGHHEGESQGGE